jgi:phage tail sheath protein FI
MPGVLYPGVYVEEVPSGSRPINGVSTSTVAFIGEARRGPVGEPVFIGKFDDFVNEFGGIESETDVMGFALHAFYLNGGEKACICRLAGSAATATNTSTPIPGEDTGTHAVLSVRASSPGSWGNSLRFKIIKPDSGSLTFSLSAGELIDGVYEEKELFEHLSMNTGSEHYAVRVVNESSALIWLTDLVTNSDYSEASVAGFSVPIANIRDYLGDTGNDRSFTLNLNGMGFRTVTIPDNSLIDTDTNGMLTAAGISVAIRNEIASTFALDPATISVSMDRNICTIATRLGAGQVDSRTEILFRDSAMLEALGITNATATVVQGVTRVIPQQVTGASSAADIGVMLEGGEETPADAVHYTSLYENLLRNYHDISVIVLPGATWDGGVGQAKVESTLLHCEEMKNRVLIVDPPENTELTNMNDVSALGFPTSSYTALYYPWVNLFNPLYHPDKEPNINKVVTIAPSSIAAGIWARIDDKRGVWKAPAGVDTRLKRAVSLQYQIGSMEQSQLNPLGVNCIRKLPNLGPVFWGARTLATRVDPEWRYINVRRTTIYLQESISRGIKWALFEPNDDRLWSSLRLSIGSFMQGLFRQGAFRGASAKEAYFVRCGLGDTMTRNDIDRGQVILFVGFAPLKPAEFVIVRIQQKVGTVS